MLAEVTQHLIAKAQDPASTPADMETAANAFFAAAGGASAKEAQEAMAALGACFSWDDPQRAGFLALVCGALVERGWDPSPIVEPLRRRLETLFAPASALADACRARLPKTEGEANNEDDPGDAFEKVRAQAALEMPAESAAWDALEAFWRPAIAVFSVSPAARAIARPLRAKAANIADYNTAGHWISMILAVLDDEPILAIEPATNLGILGRISGVVDNFQLNTLLMHEFPKSGFFARRRVPQRVADVARGAGPQQTGDIVTSVWNLYTWQAIQPDLKLPDPNDYGAHTNWIWNEGKPEDIPDFDGRRVILLGPPSYPRSWQSQRMFLMLPASLVCERKLSKDEVHGWLQRMAAAKGKNP
jgi:hypothetical protein